MKPLNNNNDKDSAAKESLLAVPKAFQLQPMRVHPNGTPAADSMVDDDDEEGLGYTHTLVSPIRMYFAYILG